MGGSSIGIPPSAILSGLPLGQPLNCHGAHDDEHDDEQYGEHAKHDGPANGCSNDGWNAKRWYGWERGGKRSWEEWWKRLRSWKRCHCKRWKPSGGWKRRKPLS